MKNEKWLDIKTMVTEFNIANSTQARMRAEKKIPYSKVGWFIFNSRDKIYEWLEKYSIEAVGV